MFRLNYAVDLRYGTLVDIARKVFAGEPVDLTVGFFNAIWQGDANSYALRSLELCSSPPAILNVTGPERIAVREIARVVRLGRSAARPVRRTAKGRSRSSAIRAAAARSSASRRCRLTVLRQWVAHWVQGGRAVAEQADALRGHGWPLLTPTRCRIFASALLRGLVIPAHPLALTADAPARRAATGRADPLLLRCRSGWHRRRGAHHAVRDPRSGDRPAGAGPRSRAPAPCSDWCADRAADRPS